MNTQSVLEHLVEAGAAMWRASWQASVLALLVAAILWTFGRRMPARWRHAMWMLVLIRLALPVVPSSPLSVFNLAPPMSPPPQAASANAVTTPAGVPTPAVAMTDPILEPIVEHSNVPRKVGISINGEAAGLGATPAALSTPSSPLPPAISENAWAGWPQVVTACWMAGALLLGLRIAWATLRVSRMMRRLDPVGDAAALALLRATATELRVRRLPTLLTGERLFSPALVGFIRPRLLLPRHLLDSFEPAELRLVFLHELAHLKRRDVAINWFATIISVLHWPNPIAWLVVWRLRLERELACDELVLSHTGTDADRRAYGHTIVKLLETLSHTARPIPGAVGILEGRQQIKGRIIMIARYAKQNRAWTAVAALLIVGLGVFVLTDAVKGEPAAAKPDSKPATAPATGPGQLEPIDRSQAELDVLANGETPPEIEIEIAKDAGIWEYQSQLDKIDQRIASLGGPRSPGASAALATRQQVQQKLDDRRETLRTAHMAAHMNARRTKPTIDANELVTVSVMDLTGPGVESIKTSRVDADGNISMPYVGLIKAQGLRPVELEEAVAKAYREKGILETALAVVSLPKRGESHRLSQRAVDADPVPVPKNVAPENIASKVVKSAPAIDPAIEAQLNRKLPEVPFNETALVDVIDFLRDVTHLNIFVDWRALEAAGVERSTPVTTNLRDVAFKDALGLILRGVGQGVHYEVENGIIRIGVTPQPERPAKVEVRTYDVDDLVDSPDIKERRVETEQLLQVVKVGVGVQANVATFGTKIIVSGTESDHRNIEAMLKVLREPAKNPTTAPAKVGQRPAEEMSVEDIARVDRTMAKYIELRDEIKFQHEQLRLSGAGPSAPSIKTLAEALKLREQLIGERAEWFRQKYKSFRFTPDLGMDQPSTQPITADSK